MYVWLYLKTIKFYVIKLITDFYWQPSYLLSERASLWIVYIGECYVITPVITLVTVTIIVLALATLGDATQIGLFLFMSLHQGKYNMCRFHRHYHWRYHVNFRQWKHGFNKRVQHIHTKIEWFWYLVGRELNLPIRIFQDMSASDFDFELVGNIAESFHSFF